MSRSRIIHVGCMEPFNLEIRREFRSGGPPWRGGFRLGVGDSGQDRTSSKNVSSTVGYLFPEPIVVGEQTGAVHRRGFRDART